MGTLTARKRPRLVDQIRPAVIELRRAGRTFREIGDLLGCSEALACRSVAGLGVLSPVMQFDRPTVCRHCNQRPVQRPRGLCWPCFYLPGVREKYQPISTHGRRGVRNFDGPAPLPPWPTPALPGTAEKVAVLEQRAERGEELFHPGDG